MSDSAIVVKENDHPLTWQKNGDKDKDFRLQAFVSWQAAVGGIWYQPDLARWRDELLDQVVGENPDGKPKKMSPASVQAYVSTVRGAYKMLLISNDVRDLLWANTDPALPPERRDVFVREILARLENAVHPKAASVQIIKMQDTEDSKHLRLTPAQANALIGAPGRVTPQAVRDTALIALLLSTGIREDELCTVDVDDLRQTLSGELALRVREGKGSKQRMVPYGDLDGCLTLVDHWLQHAGIRDGAVFRGLNKAQRLRPGRLTTRSVHLALMRYPIIINGEWVQVRPHDCRRTYARLMYENGADLLSISQNLGHAEVKTTESYVGRLDVSRRRGKAFLDFNARPSK